MTKLTHTNSMTKIAIILALLMPIRAHAVVATVTNVFFPGEKIVSQMVNQNFNDILTAVNGQLSDQNVLPGGLTAVSIASKTVTGAQIADNTITNSQLATGSVLNSTFGEPITHTSLAVGPYASGSTINLDDITFPGWTNVAQATATIVSTGKPILVQLAGLPIANFTNSFGEVGIVSSDLAGVIKGGMFRILQDGADVGGFRIETNASPSSQVANFSGF